MADPISNPLSSGVDARASRWRDEAQGRERVRMSLGMHVDNDLIVRIAGSMVLDQPDAIGAMKRLSRGADPEAEVYLIRVILLAADDALYRRSKETVDPPGLPAPQPEEEKE